MRSCSTLGSRTWRRAPTLRKWFAHDPDKWEKFRERYFRELDGQGPAIEDLARRAGEGRLTLVFAAKDSERNNAVALKDYLERRCGAERTPAAHWASAAGRIRTILSGVPGGSPLAI